MKDISSPPDFLLALANTPNVTWSIASFGAIAEFSYETAEHAAISHHAEGLSILTSRGALLYRHAPNVRVIAYEGLSKHPALWSQGISICLPESEAQMSGRSVLTESAPDQAAVLQGHEGRLMFDIGIGAPHVDACVRVSDNGLISALREQAGTPLFGDNADALNAILMNSPDRVFTSSLGRIEVYTPIASEGGETETGPHTHVLPDLLAHGRTHAANVPIPEGYMPCMNIFPPNPTRDSRGDVRVFDKRDHVQFQEILSAYGDPSANHIKQRVLTAIANGDEPGILVEALSRVERTALRVALRQTRFTHGQSAALDQWLSAYEPNKGGE